MIRHHRPRPQDPACVVVLGASGFVGRHLLGQLRARGIRGDGLASSDADLERPESVDRLRAILRPDDTLVVLSALTPDRGKDVRTLMRNLAMAEHVAAAVERVGCDHLVYVSSDAVYGEGVNPVRETAPAEPGSLYGHMHLLREKVLAEAARKVGCPLLVLRPCALYGPGDTHNSYGPNRCLRSALSEGVVRLFGAGEEKRDHLSVHDFCRLLVLGLAHRSEGVLNVATGSAVSFGELAALVAEVIQQPVWIEHQPRQGPVTHRHFDNTGLLRAFPGFRFTELRDGLAAWADLLRAEGSPEASPMRASA